MVIEAKRQVTLNAIARTSGFCYRVRLLWFVVAAAACVWFAALLLQDDGNSARMLLPLSALLWAVLGLCAGYWLAWLPAPINTSDKLLRRLYKYLIIIVYIGAAIGVLGLGLGAMALTFRGLILGAF